MGSLVLITFDDLLMKFAKNNDLGDYEIIVASHEIAGSLKVQGTISEYAAAVDYESKYENIEFVPSIRPSVSAMEHAFGSADKQLYIELYNSQLLGVEALTDLCCIVDMVVTHDSDVLIVVSAYEQAAQVLDYLRIFIRDEFLLECYLFSDLERLVDLYGTKPYDQFVATLDFTIPDEFNGIDLDPIVHNLGDMDKIKEQLELQKSVAASLQAKAGDESFSEMFFNRFTETLEEKVRSVLGKRSLDDVKDVCRDKGIRISPNATKEILIDKIIHDMKLDSARTIKCDSRG